MKNYKVRWTTKKDWTDILILEQMSYKEFYKLSELTRLLSQQNIVAFSLECDLSIIGYLIYSLQDGYLNLERLTIHPDFRRKGWGTVLLKYIINKLNHNKRPTLIIECPDDNLEGHLFLRANGLKAKINRNYFPNKQDSYRFSYNIQEASAQCKLSSI